jgi:hypothetical protein
MTGQTPVVPAFDTAPPGGVRGADHSLQRSRAVQVGTSIPVRWWMGLALSAFRQVAWRCAGGRLRGEAVDYLRGWADVGYSGHVRACVERPGVQQAGRSIVQSHWRGEEGQ